MPCKRYQPKWICWKPIIKGPLCTVALIKKPLSEYFPTHSHYTLPEWLKHNNDIDLLNIYWVE